MAIPHPHLLQLNFILTFDDLSDAVAGFSEMSGMNMETDIVEYREGRDLPSVRKYPGLHKYGNITLKRGYTTNRELWEWRKTVIDGATVRKSGAVILLNEAREPVLRFNFEEAFISKYEAPALNATANEIAIESIELVCEKVELAE